MNFVDTMLDAQSTEFLFWSVDIRCEKGLRGYGGLGTFYIIMNFVLLLFTIFSVAAYLELFSLSVRIGRLIDRASMSAPLDSDKVREILWGFSHAYLSAKICVLAYFGNIITWHLSSPSGLALSTMAVSIIVLSVFFFFILPLPCYLINHKLLKFHQVKYQYSSEHYIECDRVAYFDFRSMDTQVISKYVNYFVMFGMAYLPFSKALQALYVG
ncbi:MAG: hypothetical protein HQL89_02725 [Magnetococcales bacterium]|nr:hypothetical protein [Magnetococcales bacterium]